MATEKFLLPNGEYIDIPVGTPDETKQKFLNKLAQEQPDLIAPPETIKQPIQQTFTPEILNSNKNEMSPVVKGKEFNPLYELGVVAPYEGARKLINSTGNLIDGLGDTLGEATNFYGFAFGKDAKNGVAEILSYDEAKARGIKDPIFGEAGKIDFNEIKGFFYDPANKDNDDHTTSLVGSLAETAVQFLIPYGGLSKLVGTTIVPTTKLGKIALGSSKGAAAGYVAFDENSGRATDLLYQYAPNTVDYFIPYLKSDPNDKWYEARFKNELEGLGLGLLAEGLFKVLKYTKQGASNISNKIDFERDMKVVRETETNLQNLKAQLEEANQTSQIPKSVSDQMLEAHVVLDAVKGLRPIKNPLDIDQKILIEEKNLAIEKWKAGEASLDEALIIPRRFFNFNTLPNIKYDELGNAVRDADGKLVVNIDGVKQKNDLILTILNTFDVLKNNFTKFSPNFTDEVIRKKSFDYKNLNEVVDEFGKLTQATKDKAPLIYAHETILTSLIKYLPQLQRTSVVTKNVEQVDNVLAYIFTMWNDKGVFSSNAGGNLRTLGMSKRDLQSFQIIEENLKRAAAEFNSFGGKDVDEKVRKLAYEKFKSKLGLLDEPSAIRRVLNWVFGNKSWEVLNEVWINSLLSNPKTLAINAVGSGIASMARPLSQKLGARIGIWEEKAKRYLGFDSDNIGKIKEYEKQIDEAAETIASLWQFTGDSYTYAKQAWRKSEAILDGTNASTKTDTTSFQAIPKALGGNIINAPVRFLNATDEFFKQINYRAKVRGLAVSEAKARNLTGQEFDEYTQRYFKNSFSEDGLVGTNLTALQYAREVTFTQDLQGLAKGFQSFVNQYPALKQFFPFIRTPFNLVKAVADGTPLALGYRGKDLLGTSGNSRAIVQARGDLALGSIFLTGAYGLYNLGIIQGATPKSGEGLSPIDKFKDTDLVRLAKSQGFVPYSFRLGDKQIEFKRIEPFGTFFGLMADIGDVYDKLNEKEKDKLGASMLLWSMERLNENPVSSANRAINGSLAILSGVRDNTFSKTFFQQANDILESIMNTDANSASQYIRNKIGSFIPNVYTKIFVNDPYYRDVKNIVDEAKKRTGLGTPPSPYFNFLGEPIKDPRGGVKRLLDNVFLPITIQTIKKDILVDELIRLGEAPKKLDYFTDRGNDYRDFKSGQNTAFDKLNDLLRTYKKGNLTLREKLEKEISSDYYKNLSDPVVLGKGVKDMGAKYDDIINFYTKEYQGEVELEFEIKYAKDFKNSDGKTLTELEKVRKNNLEIISNQRRTKEFEQDRIFPEKGLKQNKPQRTKFDEFFGLDKQQQ